MYEGGGLDMREAWGRVRKDIQNGGWRSVGRREEEEVGSG